MNSSKQSKIRLPDEIIARIIEESDQIYKAEQEVHQLLLLHHISGSASVVYEDRSGTFVTCCGQTLFFYYGFSSRFSYSLFGLSTGYCVVCGDPDGINKAKTVIPQHYFDEEEKQCQKSCQII